MFLDARNGAYRSQQPTESETTIALSQTTQEPSVTLSGALERYIHALPLSGKPDHVLRRHTVDYSRAMNRLIGFIGDVPIASIRPTDIHRFAGALIAPDAIGQRPLATTSARLLLARVSSVLTFAVDAGLLQSNPVTTSRIHKRLGPAKSKRNLTENKGYSWNELVTLFSNPDYQKQRYAQGRPGNAIFWLPLIAAYTGARREEIAQLYVSDFMQDETGQWFIRIIDDRPDKSLKTDSSRRDVPLHDDLIEVGILDLVKNQPSESRVFPQLTKVSDGYAGIVSKSWRPLTQQCGVYQAGRNPLHAFRHTFKTLAREYGIPKEVSDWITGHATESIGDLYGVKPLSRMASEIQKIPSLVRACQLI